MHKPDQTNLAIYLCLLWDLAINNSKEENDELTDIGVLISFDAILLIPTVVFAITWVYFEKFLRNSQLIKSIVCFLHI